MDREEENTGRFRRTSRRGEHPHAPHGVSDSASARLLHSSDNCAQSRVADLNSTSYWRPEMDGEEENGVPFSRTSTLTRRMATHLASVFSSSDNRAQAFRMCLMQKKQFKIMKNKTRQGKALEKLAARSFLDVLQEANLESLPSHVPTYKGCWGSTEHLILAPLLLSLR